MLRDADVGAGTETERYLRLAMLRFLLLHTHEWTDEVIERLLGEGPPPSPERTPWSTRSSPRCARATAATRAEQDPTRASPRGDVRGNIQVVVHSRPFRPETRTHRRRSTRTLYVGHRFRTFHHRDPPGLKPGAPEPSGQLRRRRASVRCRVGIAADHEQELGSVRLLGRCTGRRPAARLLAVPDYLPYLRHTTTRRPHSRACGKVDDASSTAGCAACPSRQPSRGPAVVARRGRRPASRRRCRPTPRDPAPAGSARPAAAVRNPARGESKRTSNSQGGPMSAAPRSHPRRVLARLPRAGRRPPARARRADLGVRPLEYQLAGARAQLHQRRVRRALQPAQARSHGRRPRGRRRRRRSTASAPYSAGTPTVAAGRASAT